MRVAIYGRVLKVWALFETYVWESSGRPTVFRLCAPTPTPTSFAPREPHQPPDLESEQPVDYVPPRGIPNEPGEE
jgi:hypothetical protein